jgi:hypothetical protein
MSAVGFFLFLAPGPSISLFSPELISITSTSLYIPFSSIALLSPEVLRLRFRFDRLMGFFFFFLAAACIESSLSEDSELEDNVIVLLDLDPVAAVGCDGPGLSDSERRSQTS